MKDLVRSPDGIFDGALKGAIWFGCNLGIPIVGAFEFMIFIGARTSSEFWRDQLWGGITLLGLILLGGAFGAARGVLYKIAYDAMK